MLFQKLMNMFVGAAGPWLFKRINWLGKGLNVWFNTL